MDTRVRTHRSTLIPMDYTADSLWGGIMETRNTPSRERGSLVSGRYRVHPSRTTWYKALLPMIFPYSDGSGGDETRVRSPGETFPAAPALSRGEKRGRKKATLDGMHSSCRDYQSFFNVLFVSTPSILSPPPPTKDDLRLSPMIMEILVRGTQSPPI